MAIKPIDMHVLLPKLHKNDMLKAHVMHKQDNEQLLMQNVNKRDVEEKLSKVNDFEHKESPRIREDGKRGSGREQSEQQREKKQAASDQGKDDKAKGGPKRNHIDIKV